MPLVIEEAVGHASGIWVFSSVRDVNATLVYSSNQVISLKLIRGSCEWISSLIYASPVPSTRALLWDQLESLRDNIVSSWLIMGDFNEILSSSEVRGGNFCVSRALRFADLLDKCSMVNLGDFRM